MSLLSFACMAKESWARGAPPLVARPASGPPGRSLARQLAPPARQTPAGPSLIPRPRRKVKRAPGGPLIRLAPAAWRPPEASSSLLFHRPRLIIQFRLQALARSPLGVCLVRRRAAIEWTRGGGGGGDQIRAGPNKRRQRFLTSASWVKANAAALLGKPASAAAQLGAVASSAAAVASWPFKRTSLEQVAQSDLGDRGAAELRAKVGPTSVKGARRGPAARSSLRGDAGAGAGAASARPPARPTLSARKVGWNLPASQRAYGRMR